ncbi:cytochrome oxidase Cu insertion factor (SCO1/SenC/PrrC family) [Sphingomonas sp. UYP23]
MDVLDAAAAFPKARVFVAHNEGWAHFTESADQLEVVAGAFGLENRLASLIPGQTVNIDHSSGDRR